MGVLRDRFVTAKGDLGVARAPGRFENLPVGADGQVLVANSAADLGVEWGGGGGVPNATYQYGHSIFNNFGLADDGYVDQDSGECMAIIMRMDDASTELTSRLGLVTVENAGESSGADATFYTNIDTGAFSAQVELNCVDDGATPAVYTQARGQTYTNDGNGAQWRVSAEDTVSSLSTNGQFVSAVDTATPSAGSGLTLSTYDGTDSSGIELGVNFESGNYYCQVALSLAPGQTLEAVRVNSVNWGAQLWGITVTGAEHFFEQTDPAAPGANEALLYARDNGAGKTQLCVRFNTGAIQVLATEP